MSNWLLLLLLLPATLCSLTFYFFFRDQGRLDLLAFYTLVSALLALLFPLSSLLYCCYFQKKHGYFHCRPDCFHTSLAFSILTWTAFSLVVLYTSAPLFPSASPYGGFAIFYLILFSLGLAGGLLLILLCFTDSERVYTILVPCFMVPLLALVIAFFLATDGVYQKYPFFCYNMLSAVLGTLLSLVMGALLHSKFFSTQITTKTQVVQVFAFQVLGGIAFPLLPASVLLNFILLMLRENLFSGETRAFASLGVAVSYFMGVAGVSGAAFHNWFETIGLRFSEEMIHHGANVIKFFPLMQHLIQFLLLALYFSFAQGAVPTYALLSLFGFAISFLDWLIELYFAVSVKSNLNNLSYYRKSIFLALAIRGPVLFIGMLLSAVFLGIAQNTSNIFYSYPQLSLVSLLSIFYLAHKIYAVLLPQSIQLDLISLDFGTFQHRGLPFHHHPFQELRVSDISEVLEQIEEEKALESLRGQQCAICLSGLHGGTFFEETGVSLEVSRMRKCGHCFHTKCISDWLSARRNCPLDRRSA